MRVNIHPYSMRNERWFPRAITIPPEDEKSFREQAQSNHSQTVERLNERGGLSPLKIYWAYRGERGSMRNTARDHMAALQLCVDLSAEIISER